MHSCFDYNVFSFCGIPSITLEGSPEDWQTVAERARSFADLDLGWWLVPLAPVLDQFARASRREVDRPFWQSLYKLHDWSGGDRITGWILTLFPYFSDHSNRQPTQRNPWLTEESRRLQEQNLDEDLDLDDQIEDIDIDDSDADDIEAHEGSAVAPAYVADGPTVGRLPTGLSTAPFQWQYREKSFAMEFLAGFVGVAQDPQTLARRPEIGWAVREAPESA